MLITKRDFIRVFDPTLQFLSQFEAAVVDSAPLFPVHACVSPSSAFFPNAVQPKKCVLDIEIMLTTTSTAPYTAESAPEVRWPALAREHEHHLRRYGVASCVRRLPFDGRKKHAVGEVGPRPWVLKRRPRIIASAHKYPGDKSALHALCSVHIYVE